MNIRNSPADALRENTVHQFNNWRRLCLLFNIVQFFELLPVVDSITVAFLFLRLTQILISCLDESLKKLGLSQAQSHWRAQQGRALAGKRPQKRCHR